MATEVIHVQWEGPFTYEETKCLNNEYDRGVYQIYGSHPVYGSDVLVYVGKTDKRTFQQRIYEHQEDFKFGQDTKNIRYYIGRLAGSKMPDEEMWRNQIEKVEELLIFCHRPACNSQGIRILCDAQKLEKVHVLNWGNRRDLFYEVSGRAMTDRYFEVKKYRAYGDHHDELKLREL